MDQTAENILICRTCLKIVEYKAQSYGYIEDANGNLRDMMMCCVPEMDIYISPDPIICFPCIQHLINVYNFKTRCINTETIIRSYIQKNNLAEYSHVNLSVVVQDLIRINQLFRDHEEEKRKMAIRADTTGQEGFGVNHLSTHSNTTHVVNSMVPRTIPPDPNDMSFFSIPAPINNIPHIDAQSIVNINPPNVSSLSQEISQPASQNNSLMSLLTGDSAPVQKLTSVPNPPSTGLLSLQAKPNGPVFFVRPALNTHQNSNFTRTTLSEQPPPLHFLHNSHISSPISSSKAEPSVQEAKKNLQESSSEGCGTNSKSESPPVFHPIESKMRLVIRIPRSKITIPCDKNELENDCNGNKEMENMEDVEMSENDGSSNALDFHEESNRHEETIPTERNISKIYNCTCMYLTTSETLFNEHKKVCRNDSRNLVRCPHCPHVTNRAHALSKHINTMHTKAVWFLCDYCTYRSTDKSCLRRHMRKNHLEKSITETVCQVCGYSCSNQYNLSKHMTKHEISPPLDCDFCAYTTKDRSNFRKHIFTHSTKYLNCEFCSYQTNSPYQMKVHLKKLHDGVGIEDIDCRSERPVSEIINDIKAAMEEQQVQQNDSE